MTQQQTHRADEWGDAYFWLDQIRFWSNSLREFQEGAEAVQDLVHDAVTRPHDPAVEGLEIKAAKAQGYDALCVIHHRLTDIVNGFESDVQSMLDRCPSLKAQATT
ncbi:hypothetical protein [Reyranella sp.]|uniref:hypothetical protein n=1 Tax=Reyranella sp. TaxID=1929291 RepID=UPI00272F0333|nr:hypothetical protein [Reyranella sp.]MDP2377811.1 hypothetical protein [Reyranella sp.]